MSRLIERMFPIQVSPRHRPTPFTLKEIPWALMVSGRARAKENHNQSLERLAERGGLSPAEAVAALSNHPLDYVFTHPYPWFETALWVLVDNFKRDRLNSFAAFDPCI